MRTDITGGPNGVFQQSSDLEPNVASKAVSRRRTGSKDTATVLIFIVCTDTPERRTQHSWKPGHCAQQRNSHMFPNIFQELRLGSYQAASSLHIPLPSPDCIPQSEPVCVPVGEERRTFRFSTGVKAADGPIFLTVQSIKQADCWRKNGEEGAESCLVTV